MPIYEVNANRTTTYRVEADSRGEAIDKMIHGEAVETWGETHSITAVLERVCPDCGNKLTTLYEPSPDEEVDATYCDTCDREVL